MKYVLITSSRNEEAFIGRTLDSVVTQTRLPERWIIVDDGSVDRTAEIAAGYTKRFPWITLIRNSRREGRNFAAKADAVNHAMAEMGDLDFDVLGNLDTDTTFGPDYLEFLLQRFFENRSSGSLEPRSSRTEIMIRAGTASKGKITSPGHVSFSVASASARSAAMSPIPPAAWTGSR